MYPQIERVHIFFKTHFDNGFTDLAQHVLNDYLQHFIPKAIRTAEILHASDREEKFVWTLGSWLVQRVLEVPNKTVRERLERAIKTNQIVWHALPFTSHIELMDASLFRHALSLSRDLNERFAKTTIAANFTDVPGMTRAAVGLLRESGVEFLHIGVNGACPVPAVPPVFVWRDADGAEIIVNYHDQYGGITVVDGCPEALAMEFTRDNLGPHSVEEVILVYRRLRAQFPNARIVASSLDAFARALFKVRHALPVVTAEIGDTWIHGVATDPWKVARFRELSRLRRSWLETGRATETELKPMSDALLLVAEHTWGMDEKAHLGDVTRYAAATFNAARSRLNFQSFEASWEEQRGYLAQAMSSISREELRGEAKRALETLDAPLAPSAVEHRVLEPLELQTTAHFELTFGEDGAIVRLTGRALNGASKREWLAAGQRLAGVHCETFSPASYRRFFAEYVRAECHDSWWLEGDFGKPGLVAADVTARTWEPQLQSLYRHDEASGVRLRLELSMPAEASALYGAPPRLTLEVFAPHAAPELHVDLRWFEKPAARVPHAIWFSTEFDLPDPSAWWLEKLGRWVSPLDVVKGGNRALHAVGVGAEYRGTDATIRLETLDAPLIAVGAPALLRFEDRVPDLAKGLHVNLYNNVWGTNFPMWSEGDARFRFFVRLERK